jgi:hypothetical protein
MGGWPLAGPGAVWPAWAGPRFGSGVQGGHTLEQGSPWTPRARHLPAACPCRPWPAPALSRRTCGCCRYAGPWTPCSAWGLAVSTPAVGHQGRHTGPARPPMGGVATASALCVSPSDFPNKKRVGRGSPSHFPNKKEAHPTWLEGCLSGPDYPLGTGCLVLAGRPTGKKGEGGRAGRRRCQPAMVNPVVGLN